MTRLKPPKLSIFGFDHSLLNVANDLSRIIHSLCPIITDDDTWDSLPKKPLPGRLNLVLSRDLKFEAEGGIICSTLLEAIDIAREQAADDGVDEICVIGGANIYGQTLPRADRLYVTHVHADVEGDTHFPAIDPKVWKVVREDAHAAGEGDDYAFTATVYERV
ncbi:dihydrofolate reductase [Asticcacaulis sp. EMRT-3]|uniref:dihydrofolate reductase n=1 Tax=Asticcacaulis sp. EMRT-3 TaxID=3040349 RepID=UPI0024AF31FA|nr:dihydrofolate reductase [Asticcacaulis sp. EMRT-3]MDI7775239.1 dihydrofolate reductase [Asticcacaulis sp. EMRT-3]